MQKVHRISIICSRGPKLLRLLAHRRKVKEKGQLLCRRRWSWLSARKPESGSDGIRRRVAEYRDESGPIPYFRQEGQGGYIYLGPYNSAQFTSPFLIHSRRVASHRSRVFVSPFSTRAKGEMLSLRRKDEMCDATRGDMTIDVR